MRAAVIESNNGKSTVLTEEGMFIEICGSYTVGQIIDCEKWSPKAVTKKKSLHSFAAAACIVLALLISVCSITSPISYASVELGDEYYVRYILDKELKVIKVVASEESGRELADDLKADGVTGKNINEAISMAEELSGHKYDALTDPPQVKCKDDSAGTDIASIIIEHHSSPVKPEDVSKEISESKEKPDLQKSGSNYASGKNAPTGGDAGFTEGKGVRITNDNTYVNDSAPSATSPAPQANMGNTPKPQDNAARTSI